MYMPRFNILLRSSLAPSQSVHKIVFRTPFPLLLLAISGPLGPLQLDLDIGKVHVVLNHEILQLST